MKFSTLKRIPLRWRARVLRAGFNLHPVFRSTGGRVEFISRDLLHIRIRLALNRQTRNVVGSLFGGSLFSITDGVHVAMLLTHLHRDVIVWDKAAAIRYRKPAYCTVYADFTLDPADLDLINAELDRDHETSRRFTVELKDKAGTVYTVVERMVYIAEKAFYKQKQDSRYHSN